MLFHVIGETALQALQPSQLGSWILLLLREIATLTQVSHLFDKFTKQVFHKFAHCVLLALIQPNLKLHLY